MKRGFAPILQSGWQTVGVFLAGFMPFEMAISFLNQRQSAVKFDRTLSFIQILFIVFEVFEATPNRGERLGCGKWRR